MDCLICLEPITGTPFQSAKRLTCSCKAPTHEQCHRQYRAAKGHTECIICHNRDYVRDRRRSSVSEFEGIDYPLDVQAVRINALVHRVLGRNADDAVALDTHIQALIERVLAARAVPPPPPPTPWVDTLWNICFFVAAAVASYGRHRAEILR
uniref:Uncharacterized protein n=1 Tax=viral metagenome TaxID=1070528 RepID=A0A6C0KZW9_9ZZZZ